MITRKYVSQEFSGYGISLSTFIVFFLSYLVMLEAFDKPPPEIESS
tara:strand:+ start:174 stop:311 length:138 start_codon:yes stop_codon:yes gene_type:complete